MKLNLKDWMAKFSDASASLVESLKEGSISANDIKSLNEELYKGLRKTVAGELEGEVEKKLYEAFEEYLEGIREELTKEELEEAQAEGIALFLKEVGIDAELAKQLAEDQNLGEVLKAVVEEMKNPSDDKGKGKPTDESKGAPEPIDLEEELKKSPAIKQLNEQLEQTRVGLLTEKKKTKVAQLEASFPYSRKVFTENIKPILEACDTIEDVEEVYESHVNLLKSAGLKEEPKGSAQFLATDTKVTEKDTENKPESLEESLISAAAAGLKAVPAKEVA